MTIEKLPSGSYRIREYVDGTRISVTCPYKPSNKEAIEIISEKIKSQNNGNMKGTMAYYVDKYISERSNVCAIATIRTYRNFQSTISDELMKKELSKITKSDIQTEINQYAVNHAPKTVRSYHGFIASVLGEFAPNISLSTKLPKAAAKRRKRPSSDDVKRILELCNGTEDHICIQLGILGLRRGEICALDITALKENNVLSISKTKVYSKGDGWIIQNYPKTDGSIREILLPESLAEEIRERGTIFSLSPKKLNDHIHKYQDKLGIERFRFHDLRSYFASYASTLGIPEADIQKYGGWKSDFVFKRIYRESMDESFELSSAKIANNILSITNSVD